MGLPKRATTRRQRYRRLALRLLFAGMCVLLAAALTEHWIEAREAARLTASETFAKVGTARIRYRERGGNQPGVPVVFLNGMCASLEQWDYVQDRVAAFAPAITYDRAGYGFSQGSHAHDAEQQASELLGLLETLDIKRPIVLVGYSISASVARVFVARHREKVAGVLLVEPYLPEIRKRIPGPGAIRSYGYGLFRVSAKTLFGVGRLTRLLRDTLLGAHKGPEPMGLCQNAGAGGGEATVRESLARFPHWWATDLEVLTAEATASQAAVAGGLADLPLILLFGERPPDAPGRALVEVYDEFVSRTSRGKLVTLPHEDHTEVLNRGTKCAEAVVVALKELSAPAP